MRKAKPPRRLYVVWPQGAAMEKSLRHPDAFTTRVAAEDCALDDEMVVVYEATPLRPLAKDAKER